MLQYLEDFLLYIQTNNYSPETLYNYERDLKTFESFLDNELKVSFEKINKKTIEQYKAYLVSQDRKTALGQVCEELDCWFNKPHFVQSAGLFKVPYKDGLSRAGASAGYRNVKG